VVTIRPPSRVSYEHTATSRGRGPASGRLRRGARAADCGFSMRLAHRVGDFRRASTTAVGPNALFPSGATRLRNFSFFDPTNYIMIARKKFATRLRPDPFLPDKITTPLRTNLYVYVLCIIIYVQHKIMNTIHTFYNLYVHALKIVIHKMQSFKIEMKS
jgi:hypothetical protein